MNVSAFDASDSDDRTKSYTDVSELVEGNERSIWVRSENLILIFVCREHGSRRKEMAKLSARTSSLHSVKLTHPLRPHPRSPRS